jgi:hypothetical protein
MVRKKKKTCNACDFGWFLLALILKVFGIAFLIQGFVMQLTSGVLYYGALHYLIGIIFVMLAWASMKKIGFKK